MWYRMLLTNWKQTLTSGTRKSWHSAALLSSAWQMPMTNLKMAIQQMHHRSASLSVNALILLLDNQSASDPKPTLHRASEAHVPRHHGNLLSPASHEAGHS